MLPDPGRAPIRDDIQRPAHGRRHSSWRGGPAAVGEPHRGADGGGAAPAHRRALSGGRQPARRVGCWRPPNEPLHLVELHRLAEPRAAGGRPGGGPAGTVGRGSHPGVRDRAAGHRPGQRASSRAGLHAGGGGRPYPRPDLPRLRWDADDRRLALRILARRRAVAAGRYRARKMKLLPRILPAEDEEDRPLESGALPETRSGGGRTAWRWTAALAAGAAIPRLLYLFVFTDPENPGLGAS